MTLYQILPFLEFFILRLFQVSQILFSFYCKTLEVHLENFKNKLFLANVGGWIKSNQDSEVVDLELDEAEDISQDKSIGPESPSTPLVPSKSQTKM